MNKQEPEVVGLLETNARYSKHLKYLIEALRARPELQNRRLELESEDVVDFMRVYENRVNAWPVFVSKKMVEAFNNFIGVFPGAVYKSFDVINRVAPKELQELGVHAYHLLKAAPFKSDDLLIRYDMVFSDGTFKVVEANSGSTIGGWQLDWLEGNFWSSLDCLKSAAEWNVKYTNITRELISAVVRSMGRLSGAEESGNLLVLDKDVEENSGFHRVMARIFDEVKSSRFPKAKLFFIPRLEEIGFRPDGKVVFDGHAIDGILLSSPQETVPRELAMRLSIAFLGGKLAYPDSPFHVLAGNKLALAMLHDPRVRSELSSLENEMVDKHVPWAARASLSEFSWGGEVYASKQFFRKFKDAVVLKKNHSFQGKDVVVGRFSSEDDWGKMVEVALMDGDWLVQQYCKPDPLLLCDDALGITPFEVVWGVFHLSDRYGGAFVRGVPTIQPDSSRSGVINSAQGAREFPVFEERE